MTGSYFENIYKTKNIVKRFKVKLLGIGMVLFFLVVIQPTYHICVNLNESNELKIADIYLISCGRLDRTEFRNKLVNKNSRAIKLNPRNTGSYSIYIIAKIDNGHVTLVSDGMEYGPRKYAKRSILKTKRSIASKAFRPYKTLELPISELKWLVLKRVIAHIEHYHQ